MAVIDKGALIDQAQKFVQKGLIDRAISEYQKVVEADPKDLRTHLKIAELYLKKGNKASAVAEYTKVAESYTADGFNLQAIAVYKQILKIDPSIYDIYARLADLYKKQGLIADALAQYRIVIGNYEKEGKVREVIDTLKQMASMDSENFSIRLKLAELYLKNGNRKEALDEYSVAAEELEKKGRTDDAIILYQKLLSADQTYTTAHISLGKIYLKARKRSEAVSHFKIAIEKNPNDVKALLLLAGVYAESEDFGKARQAFEKVLEIDPSSVDARKGIFRALVKEGDYKGGIAIIMPVVDKALEEKSYDGALSILFEFYRNNAKEPLVLEKMAEAYSLKGEKEKEAGIRDELAHIYESRGGIAKEKEVEGEGEPELLKIEEASMEELPLEELPLEEHFIPREKPPVPPSSEVVARSLTEAEVYLKYGLTDKAIDILLTAVRSFPENIEVHRGLKAAYERVGNLANAAAELVSMAAIAVKTGGTDEATGYLQEALRLNPGQEDAVRMLVSVKKPAAEEVSLEVEMPEEALPLEIKEYPLSKVAEVMEEADFYIQQGLYDDARDICNRILKYYPDNREAILKLKAIDEAAKVGIPAPEFSAENGAEEGFFDLAAELGGAEFETLTTPPGMREAEKFGFEDIFSEFKKGVESQLEKEDTETHYSLGIAYKEMGLVDDAIREFNIAATDPKKEFDSYNLIGICYIEKREPQKAIEVFKKGLRLPGRSEDEYASMNYDMGQAYELAGMNADALTAYTETQKRSPGFRDVEAKIASLGGGREVKKRRVSFV